jgi:trehalose 6-phosphate synthase
VPATAPTAGVWPSPAASEEADARIVIVANRGPNDFVWQDGDWATRRASGGLVSMLTPLARRPGVVWFCCVSEPPDARRARRGLFTTAADQVDTGLDVVPVPLPADVYHAYYGQISNEVLWMLQHHVVGPGGYAYLDHRRHQAWEQGYLEANRRLAAAIAAACPAPEAFLVQDYHLYPLPRLLRAAYPRTPILHFTHIPFPDVLLMRLLPRHWRSTILLGMLGADCVGLQTHGDVQAFLHCCTELLGAKVDPANSAVLAPDGREVAVRTYPASIDPEELAGSMAAEAVEQARRRLTPALEELTIIRVDRLDPSKNQLIGFQAFARLLEMRPDLRRRVQFLAFLVPSRTDLGIYRAYRNTVYRKIEEVNARFTAACGRPPIRVFYTNDRDQALAAMEGCDVLLINSLEDGMNLVAKEWAIVSRRPGVLVLSETAGVVEQAEGALLISPLDIEGTARALGEALDMPTAERAERLARFRGRVLEWTNRDWLAAQLAQLGVQPETPLAVAGR